MPQLLTRAAALFPPAKVAGFASESLASFNRWGGRPPNGIKMCQNESL